MTAERVFVVLALFVAFVFTFITPPFQVPDEVGHFWRGASIGYGTLLPQIERAGGVAHIPQGFSTLVYVFWRDTAGARHVKITRAQFETSWYVRMEAEKSATVILPAGYTPVAYAPQTIGTLIGRATAARPVITFYLGRLLNAMAYVLLIAIAIRITPGLRWIFAAAGLLPMAMYLAASWSPDAMTIALSFLFTAMLLRGARTSRDVFLIALIGLAVALCKPAYFLIALLALVVPFARRSGRFIVIAATAAGVAFSMWNASRTLENVRPSVNIDPPKQIACLRTDPARLVAAFEHEIKFDYISQMVGRLGLLDVVLPDAVVWAELALLLMCAFTAASVIPQVRIAAFFITILTIGGIALSLYIGWTSPCATLIDGLQGRYLLPIVPLTFAIISAPLIRREQVTRIALAVIAFSANAVALFVVASRYYW